MTNTSPTSKSQHDFQVVKNAVKLILRPIVRILLHRRVGYPLAAEVLQDVFVEQASLIAARNNPRRRSSISALALATGIRANLVSKKMDESAHESIGMTCPEAAILADWADDPMFSDQSTGKPTELAIYGKGRSFQTLVKRSTAGSIGYGLVLDELLKSGNISLVNNDKSVKLEKRFFTPAGAPDDNTLEILSRAYSHLGFTVAHNISPFRSENTPGHFQQELYSRRIRAADHDLARNTLNEMLRDQHSKAYDAIANLESKSKVRSGPEIGVGYYYFEVKNYIEGCGSG